MVGRVRVGIIGVGLWAFLQHIPALRASDRTELVAIARRSPERLAAAQEALGGVAAYADWRELLDRAAPDAVLVATPHAAHAAPTVAALERGMHVLVEKPLATTTADARMMAAAARGDRVLMVAYQQRGDGVLRAAQRALAGGAIGPVRQVAVAVAQDARWALLGEPLPPPVLAGLAAMGVPASFLEGPLTPWRRDPAQAGGGFFADTGSHAAALALWLAGAPAGAVAAFAEPTGAPTDLRMAVQARLANGGLVSLTTDGAVAGQVFPRYTFTATGDRGVLTGHALTGQPTEVWLERAGAPGGRERVEPQGADQTPVAAFLAAILDGAPNPTPAAAAAQVVALTEAAYRSAAEGRIVQAEPAAAEVSVT